MLYTLSSSRSLDAMLLFYLCNGCHTHNTLLCLPVMTEYLALALTLTVILALTLTLMTRTFAPRAPPALCRDGCPSHGRTNLRDWFIGHAPRPSTRTLTLTLTVHI